MRCALLIRVKRARSSGRVFWVATILAAGGVFLPWISGPERLPHAYAEAAEELRVGTRTVLGPGDFLWFKSSDLGAALGNPFSGANVWGLFAGLRSGDGRGRDDAACHGAGLLVRPDRFAGGIYALVLLPAAVLVMAFLGARDLRGSPWAWMAAILLLGIYGLGRWRVAATEGARAAAGIEIGLGAWLTLLAALLAGLAFLARACFPKARWI